MFSKLILVQLLPFYILFCTISASRTKPSNTDLQHHASRVINGQPVTDKSEYPFVVDLSFHQHAISSSRFCTATLIAPDIILTAAHCVINDVYTTPIYATIGRIQLDDKHTDNHKSQTFRTIASIAHPNYRGLGSPNDVALMLLNASSPAPTVRLSERSPNIHDVAWVVGYGVRMVGTVETSSRPIEVIGGRLQKTALRIMDIDFCNRGMQTEPGMLCTKGVHKGSSACKGDSGGGLFLRKKQRISGGNKREDVVQVGIVSYGDAQCSSEESGVFTDVASVKDWVQLSVERLNEAFSPVDRQVTSNSARLIGLSSSTNGTISRLIGHLDSTIKYYNLHSNSTDDKSVTVPPCQDSGLSGTNAGAKCASEGVQN